MRNHRKKQHQSCSPEAFQYLAHVAKSQTLNETKPLNPKPSTLYQPSGGCDVILVNADGRVVEKGNHDELMAMKGVWLDS